MAVQAFKDPSNDSVVPVLSTPFSKIKEEFRMKQPKTNDELRQLWPRKYGVQKTGFSPLEPKVADAITPKSVRELLFILIVRLRMTIMERDERTGGAFHHLFSMKTDKEIIDKILSYCNENELQDLLRLVDGTGISYEEFITKYISVSESKQCGVYLIGGSWETETLSHFGYSERTNSVDFMYVGLTLVNFKGRYSAHTRWENNQKRKSKLQLLRDIAGLNENKNKFHYIALFKTTRKHLEKDPFIFDLERGRVRSDCKEDMATCFMKTVEALFITMFWTCQTKDWLNHSLRQCMPWANPILGVNAIPSLHFGEVANMIAYTQNPRIEEKKDRFRSYTFIQLLEILESIIEEFMRRSDVKKLKNESDPLTIEAEQNTLPNRFKRLADTVFAVINPKRAKVEGDKGIKELKRRSSI